MTRKDISKLFKRFLITFLCSLPVLIALGFLLTNKVSDFVMIVIFVVIAGGAFAVEELVHFKLYQKRERLKQEQLKKWLSKLLNVSKQILIVVNLNQKFDYQKGVSSGK